MKEICKLNECTACHACYNVCPNDCILFKVNENGFILPSVDESKCIDCGACCRVCPNISRVSFNKPDLVFAAIAKDENDYKTATSGGIATTFSKYILSKNGIVYGAAIDSDLKVRHIRVDSISQIDRLKGSKYVQSEIGNCFKFVQSDLKEGKIVLFIGTPCQIAGLRNYLGKEYSNLYLVDIICHGVPPYKYLLEHIESISDENIDSISFRKDNSFMFELKKGNHTIYEREYFNDLYYVGFLRRLIYQDACYECKYASINRCSDITIGDFWGFDEKKKSFIVSHSHGLSAVFINNAKGKKLFQACSEYLLYQVRELEEAVKGNKQLRHPSVVHKNRNKFLKLYQKKGFEKAAKKALRFDRLGYIVINKIP